MQTTSATWTTNQAEIISAPGEMSIVALVDNARVLATLDFDNDPAYNYNLNSARITSAFDPTRATLPIGSSTINVESGVAWFIGSPPVPTYDFAEPGSLMDELRVGPTKLTGELGFRYDLLHPAERIPLFRHGASNVQLAEDGATLVIDGEDPLALLDRSTFRGGRFDPAGIDAVTVLTEILTDSGLTYGDGMGTPAWLIDSTLAAYRVVAPVPVVSHKQAIQMVAAYVGADVRVNRIGQIVISRDMYVGEASDYTIDVDRVYDRPKDLTMAPIGAVDIKMVRWSAASTSSVILEQAITTGWHYYDNTSPDTIVITHDPCHNGTLTIVSGSVNILSVTYGLTETTFQVDAWSDFTVRLTGYKVTKGEYTLRVVNDPSSDQVIEYANPLCSDPAYAQVAVHEYLRWHNARRYEMKMRDDPAIDTGDRVAFEMSTRREYAIPNASGAVDGVTTVPVVVGEITREFAGSIDGKYVLYENTNRYAEDFSTLTDGATVIGYDGWQGSGTVTKQTVGATSLAQFGTDSALVRNVDLRAGSILAFSISDGSPV